MKEYKREYPIFSLCGLNCGLCPRYHTEGSSKCPGCGGVDFALSHPSCSVITCSKKHDNVAFCFECKSYPCAKYERPNDADSFISYKNVLEDQKLAKEDLGTYLKNLERKQEILTDFISNYNDGKLKGFYCLAVNLLPLAALEEVIVLVKSKERSKNTSPKENAEEVKSLIMERAACLGIEIKLRK